MKKGFVIIGAGNGGQSLAGDIVLRGKNVAAIYDKNLQAVEAIAKNGGIKMSGPVVQGFAPIQCATNNLEEAMSAGDVFLVAITSNFHKALASEMASYIKPEHTVVLLPGYVGSSILFSNTLRKCGVKELPLIGEAASFPYATRLLEPAHAGIKARKVALPVAALPATRNQEFIKIVQEAIPEAYLSSDSLSVGFNNVNPATHVAFYLFNLGKVESPESKSSDFHSWGTPTVVRIQYEMDAERLAIMKAMELETISYDEFHEICYQNKHYAPIPQGQGLPASASQAPDRFIDEDVPMGLVPMSDFGKKLGVPTPIIDLLIQMSNVVRKRDFTAEGSTLESLGLSGMSIEEILTIVRG
ncbi:NAD/NADP-dependent octopine/nopaline dehydrogenase family protein [Petroclostridium sp. X23]|uniref:NAD/NADP-dependent octopine/nopaline dehydrogenase family protein n=1 Tax=Petroclostridium sp. X23 TaxID=3045146 RepID=UPI0024ACE6A2|nr:NAD/NADP-dependent octopine/nopaline dehydrogenase family protein [Petroclostridium sp. X23]WHH58210.1 NAD/NADP octopine/nopaline dehydrogenase family protein [Petroclostridium sp. X23]